MKARNTNTCEVVTHFGISKEFGTISYVARLAIACADELIKQLKPKKQ